MVIFISLHFDRCIPAVRVTNPLSWRLLFFLSMEETRMSADSMLAQLQRRIAPMQSMTRLWAAYAKDDVAPLSSLVYEPINLLGRYAS